MSIVVRIATVNDIDAIEQLYDDLNDYLETHENYPRWKKGVYPIREDAYCEVEWQIEFDVPVITICKLAVHPKYFGCGVGKALLDYAVCVGEQRNSKAIRLDVYEENIPAIRLYEKCGFKNMGLVDLGLEELYGLKWYRVFEKVLEE